MTGQEEPWEGTEPQVTVSMPYWRCAGTVRRAVDAVLGQTHTALTLVVVNDGDHASPPWPALADITDPRLVRAQLPVNRGRYWADAVVLAAATTDWFAIHDADDHAEPDWLAALLAVATAGDLDAVFAPQRVVALSGASHLEPTALQAAGGPRMMHVAHHAALYRTAALRAVGGPHPGYRIGYDSLLVNLMAMGGRCGQVTRPLYTRVARAGSLTRNPTTGSRSEVRRGVRRRLEQMYTAARTEGPAAVIARDIPADVAAQVAADAAALTAGHLTPPAPAATGGGAQATPVWGGWALDRHTALELAAALHRDQPKVVVECGSGASTLLLAAYVRASGAVAVSLEHDPRFHRHTREALTGAGLTGLVDVRLAPLQPHFTPRGGAPWYDTALPAGIDFALVDGPPGTIGRQAALYALHPHLTGDWQVWCDDAQRLGEQAALRAWEADLPVHVQEVPLPRGLAVIRPRPPCPSPVDASDVAVTLLTGRRPTLLTATVLALHRAAPGLLESAHVTVLHNGDGDHLTAALLDQWAGWINQRMLYVGPRDGHGPAATRLLDGRNLAGRRYVLHLEDDWAVCTLAPDWLDTARAALAAPTVGQVRLRHRGDPVRDRHMVTGKPIEWTEGRPGVQIGAAHYTLNPSLMRTADLPAVWPADDEAHAMRRFHATGLLTAQLTPGVFRHIGGKASLHPGRQWQEQT